MNTGQFSGFPGNFHTPYATAMESRDVFIRDYTLQASDAGTILFFRRNFAVLSNWTIPESTRCPVPPLTFFHIAYTGASYMTLTPAKDVTLYMFGDTKVYSSSVPMRLYGPAGFCTLMRGFDENWYIGGSGLTT